MFSVAGMSTVAVPPAEMEGMVMFTSPVSFVTVIVGAGAPAPTPTVGGGAVSTPTDPLTIPPMPKTVPEPAESVHEHLTEDGRVIHHECKALPSMDEKGRVYQVVYIIDDVTEKRALEEELRERTLRLERSNRLKGLLMDIMTHDLLNSITAIQALAGVLAEEAPSDKFKSDVGDIEGCMDRLEETIEDVRKFARLEGVEELSLKERDLAGVVEGVMRGLRGFAESRNIAVSCDVKRGSIALVNPLIKDVFSNLLSNAIKYSPEGGRVVLRVSEKDDVWEVMVKDQGIGVPDEYKERIFERFERGGKEGVKGTGLGLAIVKRIVELHQGKVWVEDNPEGGSVFYVTIPKKVNSSRLNGGASLRANASGRHGLSLSAYALEP
jgi:signal transduction histidine kinase